jgi:hypothetical protein
MNCSDESHPSWERMRSESAKAYGAARVYFELRASRSLGAVARRLEKHVSQMERWSKTYGWVSRAAAFDQHLDAEERKQFEREELAQSQKWRQREAELAEREYHLGQKLVSKAEKMLDIPLTRTITEDGKTVVQPARWTVKDAARLAREGTALSRGAILAHLNDDAELKAEEWIIEDYLP